MKKILSLVLAMLMIFSMVPAVFAAETSESDYQAAIEYLKAIDVYKGTSEGDAADELVERNQMALFTSRMVTGRTDDAYWETDANDSGFTDVDALRADVLGAVCYAKQQGIVNGIGGSEFAPYDNVTYRDAIVMIVRALGFNYPDSGYPWSYINKARELRVLDGITGVSYTAEVKREVIAQLLYNAINAEIKGETIAASVFGVEETIVMVTATPDGIVYKADGKKSVKANTVRVSAVDANGEPIGTEYYVPFKALGLKNDAAANAAANAAVGTYFKLTHKGNFSKFLACESLTQVFENTTEKKDVKYDSKNNLLTLNKKSYLVLKAGDSYSTLTNNQGTESGSREIKVFQAWGADNTTTVGNVGYYLSADGKVYSYENPFYPYAIYSDVTESWFKVSVDDHGVYRYAPMTPAQVSDMLKDIGGKVKGFSEIGRSASVYTRISMDYGVDYDYYKAFATDTDCDGDFDRVTVRAYNMYLFQKGTRKGVASNGKETDIDTFTLTKFTGNGLTASMDNTEVVATWDAEYSYEYNTEKHPTYDFFRFTGIAYNELPNKGIIVAYLADGVGSEQELEVVDVADKMSAYIRGYDQASDSLIYGSDYATIKLGYMGVAGTSIYRATQCHPDFIGSWKVNSANYIRQFWNEYVDMYVLNDSVVYIDNNNDADDYVILESITGFSDEGLTAIAYSTKAGGKTEILINELNGWHLAGFDYDLYEEMIRLQALLGDKVQLVIPPMPVQLNKVYAVRYVNEDGAYNLINPLNTYDKEIYVNNYGYIIGVDKDGEFDPGNRVATSDKDLWFILAEDEGKVYPFQGKLASIYLTGTFYKAKNNQFVLKIANADQLNGILGDSMEGYDYYLYNTKIDNEYKNANIFGSYVYGHAMQNIRTGKVDFITYDPKLAADLNKDGKWYEGQYIGVRDGAIFQTVSGVLKEVEGIHTLADVAALEFIKGAYEKNSFAKVAVGAVVPAGVDLKLIPGNVNAAYSNYGDLVDVSDFNKKIPAKGSLVDVITDTLYEGVYGSDFDKGHVSYENAIRLELAHKVTFISLEADGTRTTWTAAKDNAYQAKTLGTDTHAVYAYVMYDFANAKATVFVDTKGAVELTSSKPDTKTDIITGVNANITYDSNVMKGETAVTIKFSKPVNVATVTVAGKTISNLWIGSNSVSFVVPNAGFEATDDITVTGEVLNLAAANRIAGMALESVHSAGQPSGYAPSSFVFDGVIASTAFNGTTGTWAYRTTDYGTVLNAPNATTEVAAPHSYTVSRELPDGYYWDSVVIKVADTPVAQIDALSVVLSTAYTGGDTRMLVPGYEIFVSSNGTEWRSVCKATDLVAKGEWTALEATTDLTATASVANFALDNATNVKYIALAKTEFCGHGDANQATFTFVVEISAFEHK